MTITVEAQVSPVFGVMVGYNRDRELRSHDVLIHILFFSFMITFFRNP